MSLYATETFSSDARIVEISRSKLSKESLFPKNMISTGKYTLITFLPKNIFEQFHRIANIWFLIVSIFQVLPFNLSPTSSWATIAPLCLVLSVTMMKDGYQDFQRHKMDKVLNSKPCSTWNFETEKFELTTWKGVEVGHVVLVENEERIPADLVLINSSSNEKTCFIETSSLDGESNLKLKTCVLEVAGGMDSASPANGLKGAIHLENSCMRTEHPNNRLHSFEASMKIRGHPRAIPLDINNLVLRGSTLKNTKWILGVVTFTGPDTKLAQNSKPPTHKRSSVEIKVNKYLIIVFSVLFVIVTLSTSISIAFSFKHKSLVDYFAGSGTDKSPLVFFTFMILYNSFVPISLYVTMDIVRVAQAKFIQWDLKMFADHSSAHVKNGDLNEELGQIEYIFTDKTGTLTENSMIFKKCSVNGKIFEVNFEDEKSSMKFNNFSNEVLDLQESLKGSDSKSLEDFLEILALCNTVIIDSSGLTSQTAGKNVSFTFTGFDNSNSSNHRNGKVYQAASPDEEALVAAADHLGVSLVSAKPNLYTLKISLNQDDSAECLEYKVLGINEFTSERKRMSIVLEPLSDKFRPAMLLCKGADSSVLPLCLEASHLNGAQEIINGFASQGLRTLVFAKRNLSESEAADFERKFNLARNSLYDRSKRLEELAEEFETGLHFEGITGIEDKIQESVPQTITGLQDAGIKVWMLTGDKQETAINVSYSTQLLTPDMSLIKLNCKSIEETRKSLKTELSKYVESKKTRQNSVLSKVKAVSESVSQVLQRNELSRSFVATKYQIIKDNSESLEGEIKIKDIKSLNQCLAIDGLTLSFVLSDLQSTKYFIILTALCKTVICCRTTPLQKSEIVKLVKAHLIFKPVTLAVGDGANDVSMIREAHVGIGIVGNEGMQAANSSDFAIGRFHFLLRLLQIHGRWNYSRISRVILYCFYKNFVQVLPLFYYSFINLYSGTSYYDSWLMLGYNIIFTALPVIVMGTIDQDLSASQLLKHTELYSAGIFSHLFNAKIFLKWSLKAVIHSLLIFFLLPDRGGFTQNIAGGTESSDVSGTASFFVVVQTATYEILLETEHWNCIFLVVTIFSVVLFYPFIYMYDKSSFPTSNLNGVTTVVFNSHYFLYILLTPCVCLLFSLSLRYIVSFFTENNAVDSIKRKTNKVLSSNKYLTTVRIKRKTETNRIYRYSNCINSIFVSKGLNVCSNQDEDKDFYSTYKYLLYFKHAFLEKIYENYLFEKNFQHFRRVVWLIFFGYLAWTVPDYFLFTSSILLSFRSVTLFFVSLSFIISFTRCFRKYYQLTILLTLSLCLAVKIIQESVTNYDGSLSSSVYLLLSSVLLKLPAYKLFIINVLFLGGFLARLSSHTSSQNSDLDSSLVIFNYLVLLSGILMVSSYTGFSLEKSSRNEFSMKKQLEFKLEKAQAILGYLLPDFVKDRVKQGVTYIEEKESVTVVFCDIYNFDLICATHDSEELLELLDKFFAVLDQLCEKNGVTKIETVNKTYMICGGLLTDKEEMHLPFDVKARNHAERCVETALQILKQIEPVYLKTDNKLQVKIGINSGKVIAGVVGEHKPQFALVGNTVNTAARMCQTLEEPDKIQISSSTFELISHEKYFFQSSTVAPKGLDVQETFILDLAKYRKGRRRDIRVDEEDSKLFESSVSHYQEKISELRPSYTILLPEIDRSHVSHSVYNCDLDQINMSESEGVDLVGPIQWLQCTLKETKIQSKFRISLLKHSELMTLTGIIISIVVYSLELLIFVIGFSYSQDFGSTSLIALKILCISAMILMSLKFKKNYRSSEFPWIVMIVYIATSFISTVSVISVPSKFNNIQVLQVLFTNLVVTHLWKLTLSYVLLASIFSYTSWICVVFKTPGLEFAIETSAYVSVFFIFNVFAKVVLELQARRSYNLNKFAKKEIRNTEKLLNQMMPPQVLRNLHNDITVTDRHSDVTIIYADISGFTSFCKTKEPIEVVSMLSKLFSTFDHLCVRHNVYKVHTIGDCYVILSFTDGELRDAPTECVNCVEMALDMVKAIKKVNRSKGLSLNMRIGMHTGTVIAGITGTNIVRYDIYGPDNDIANKMESHGCPGKINLSQVTKSLLESQCPGRFDYEFNKIVRYSPTNEDLEAYFLIPMLESDIVAAQD